MNRTRFVFLLAVTVVVFTGLASRRYREQLPAFLAEYAGDTLWALMVFLLVSTLLAGRPILTRAAISLALAFLIEISQFYHAPWIDSIRQRTLGGLVLGFGFLWTDFVCYSVGIAAGSLTEWGIGRFRRPKLEKAANPGLDVLIAGTFRTRKSGLSDHATIELSAMCSEWRLLHWK